MRGWSGASCAIAAWSRVFPAAPIAGHFLIRWNAKNLTISFPRYLPFSLDLIVRPVSRESRLSVWKNMPWRWLGERRTPSGRRRYDSGIFAATVVLLDEKQPLD